MHTGQIKEKLKPAHEELKDKGVCDAKYVKRARGAWDVIYDDVRGSATRELPKTASSNEPPTLSLEAMLRERGIANPAELASKHAERKILDAIENFDDRKRHGEDIGAGWLGKAIRSKEPFGFRKGYRRQESSKPGLGREAKRIASEKSPGKKELPVQPALDAVKKRKRSEFLAMIEQISVSQRDSLEIEAIRRAHQGGDRFRADHIQRLRREGESLEDAGVIRQQFWWEYILTPSEASDPNALVTNQAYGHSSEGSLALPEKD
jgi:hypothetical protein